jgi:hypothetical protein
MGERQYYEGECFGGPLHGQRVSVRYPKGFLVVDKPGNKAWVYKYNDGQFHSGDEMQLDHDKRLKAAQEFDYDVVSI